MWVNFTRTLTHTRTHLFRREVFSWVLSSCLCPLPLLLFCSLRLSSSPARLSTSPPCSDISFPLSYSPFVLGALVRYSLLELGVLVVTERRSCFLWALNANVASKQ